MTPEPRSSLLSPRGVVGLLIVAFGALLLLDNLNLVHGVNPWRLWPFALIAVGVAKVLQDRSRSSRIGGGIMIVIGALLAAEQTFDLRIDVWRYWPLAIVAFGVTILWKALNPVDAVGRQEAGPVVGGGNIPFGTGSRSEPQPGSMEQTISDFAVWSGIVRRVSSPAFRRGDLVAMMGGIELDLRQAGTDRGEAVIDVFVLWGGIDITVPPDWAVSNQVTPILGGAEDKSTGNQQSRHRLIVKGVVIMGGVEIKT